MKRTSLLRKPGTLFTKRLACAAIIGIFLPVVALSACTSVSVRSAEDVRALAGTWKGSGYVSGSPATFLFMTLVIHEDGSYEMTGSVTSKGIIKIAGNHIVCGPFDLWIYDYGKSRVLQGPGYSTQGVAFSRRR